MVRTWCAVLALAAMAAFAVACPAVPTLLKQGDATLGREGRALPGGEGEARLYTDRLEFTPRGGGAVLRVPLGSVEAFQLDLIGGVNTKTTKGLVLLDKDKAPLIEIIVDDWRAWAGPLSAQLKKR